MSSSAPPRTRPMKLVRLGKVVPDSRASLIRVNFGLAVRDDVPKPDTGTPAALRNTLLSAKRILITDPATGSISGVHLMEVLGKLGIADAVKRQAGVLAVRRRLRRRAARQRRSRYRGAGRARDQCVRGVTFLEYPKEFQRSIVFFAGIGTDLQNSEAAKSYMTFIKGPQTAAAIKANCLTPG